MAKKKPSNKPESKLTTVIASKEKDTSCSAGHCYAAAISKDEIAMRAYFISERRHQLGWAGNEVTDWTQAEQQLLAEAQEQVIARKK